MNTYRKTDLKKLKILVKHLYGVVKDVPFRSDILGYKDGLTYSESKTCFMINTKADGTSHAISYWIDGGKTKTMSIYEFMITALAKRIVNTYYVEDPLHKKKQIYHAIIISTVESNVNIISHMYKMVKKMKEKNGKTKIEKDSVPLHD